MNQDETQADEGRQAADAADGAADGTETGQADANANSLLASSSSTLATVAAKAAIHRFVVA